jgi:hypothetical protein
VGLWHCLHFDHESRIGKMRVSDSPNLNPPDADSKASLVCPGKKPLLGLVTLRRLGVFSQVPFESVKVPFRKGHMLALARSLLRPFSQAYYSSIYLVLEWWTIIIQLRPKENSVRTLFCRLQRPPARFTSLSLQ